MRDIKDYTKNYEERSFEEYQVKYRRKTVLEQINKYQPASILELGCGKEPLFLYLNNVDFTIVEPSEDFFSNAKTLAKKIGGGNNIHVINGYFGEDPGLKLEKTFDMIICSGLLHEVESPRGLIHSITKICQEDTIVHINVPNADSVHRLLALEAGLLPDTHKLSRRNILYQQHNVFDLTSLKTLVLNEQMEIMDEGSYFIKFFSHEQMLRLLDEQIITENILEGFYGLEKYMPGLGSEIYVNCKISRKN